MGAKCCNANEGEEFEVGGATFEEQNAVSSSLVFTLAPSQFVIENSRAIKNDYTIEGKLGEGIAAH